MKNWEDSTRQKMLHLKLPTDPRWVDLASKNIEEILIDHAYCEQKAASSCISLIVNFHDFTEVVDLLTPVVAEEWGHFERVLALLKKRGYTLGKPRKDEYVVNLVQFVKKGGSRRMQLTEQLLMNALIEARSCERFKKLSQELEDEELRKFYYELMISEAGHYSNFLNLAKTICPEDEVLQRWEEWLVYEAEVLRQLDIRGDRVHF
jgi:tRNA 2-(methylsulfanyl)-N6-isopentenyladenosine37 hydroxylase